MNKLAKLARDSVAERPTLSLFAFFAFGAAAVLMLPDVEGLNPLSGLLALGLTSIAAFFPDSDGAADSFDWPRAAFHLAIAALFGLIAPLLGLGYASGSFWQATRKLHASLGRP